MGLYIYELYKKDNGIINIMKGAEKKMKLKKKLILIISALFVMVNGISVGAEISDKQVTMDDINASSEKTIAISE